MKVGFCGVAGALPAAGHDNVSFVVEAEGATVLVDCSGTPAARLAALGVDPGKLDALVLTHAHTDHLYAVPSLIHSLLMVNRRRPLVVAGNGPALERARALMDQFGFLDRPSMFPLEWWDLEEQPLELSAGAPTGAPASDARFVVRAQAVEHSVPTIGLRFTCGEAVLGYSGDTRPCSAVDALLAGASVVIHEASAARGSGVNEAGHSSAVQAGEAAARAGARKLFLVHLPPDGLRDGGSAFTADAAALFHGEISVPETGRWYEVPGAARTPENARIPESRRDSELPSVEIERFIGGKYGDPERCEDALFAADPIWAVVDGATNRSDHYAEGPSRGRIAADLVLKALAGLNPELAPHDAMRALDGTIREWYVQQGFVNDAEREGTLRASASVAVYNAARGEVWLLGDCHALIDGVLITNRKTVDELNEQVRAFVVKSELTRGTSVASMLESDPSRPILDDLVIRQQIFQNQTKPDPTYGYFVLDGFLPEKFPMVIHPVPPGTRSVVLASDGYPHLYGTLEATEAALQSLLKTDPLMVHTVPSTKGLYRGQASFDDRAYLRIGVVGEKS